MTLSQQQQATMAAAFEVYDAARRPVVQQVHTLAEQLHAKLGLLGGQQVRV